MTALRWAPALSTGPAAPVAGAGGATAGRTGAELVRALLEELENLPAQPSAASRVLWVSDDPRASASDLAGAVSADPALTARAMRMANSAYYGLSGRVSSATFAVTVLGFATVRSLAVATAAGVLGDEADLPPGFWDHAAGSACAVALVSPRFEVNRHEGFSLGLLHDLGSALLRRAAPDQWEAIHDEVGDDEGLALIRAEEAAFGTDHARAAATVLSAWRFPETFIDAIEHHHARIVRTAPALRRALVAGQALAVVARGVDKVDERRAIAAGAEALALAGLDEVSAPALAAQVRAESAELTLTLTSL